MTDDTDNDQSGAKFRLNDGEMAMALPVNPEKTDEGAIHEEWYLIQDGSATKMDYDTLTKHGRFLKGDGEFTLSHEYGDTTVHAEIDWTRHIVYSIRFPDGITMEALEDLGFEYEGGQ